MLPIAPHSGCFLIRPLLILKGLSEDPWSPIGSCCSVTNLNVVCVFNRMKKADLKRMREERHKKSLKRRKAEKKTAAKHPSPCSLHIPFEFKPSLVFHQSYSWILYDIFK